jgi:hypothetical protein
MRSLLVWILVASAAAPAAAQGLPEGGGLDKFMKDSAAQQRELQGLVERKKVGKAAPRKAKKAPRHAPPGATDFKPSAGHPTVEMFLSSSNIDATQQQMLRSTFDGYFTGLGQLFRPNSVASGAGFALGVSIEIANETELPEADARELVTGVNDMLAASAEFKKLTSAERQALYEVFVMTGALLQMMRTAGDTDPALKTQAQDMAKQVISQVSGLAAR